MAFGYKSGDRDQLFLLPPNMLDWLEEDHLALFVIDLVEMIDTSMFDEPHRFGPGRPAYDPEMLLALLLYAYAIGMRSSRAIEAACRTDVAFRVIAANLVPDHVTVARFRAENEAAIKRVFTEVLKLCRTAGLASLGLVAIDGTKIGSDAALDKNRDLAWIRTEIDKILAEATAKDATEGAEQESLFPGRLPEPLRRRQGRLARLEAALREGEAAEQAARDRNVATEQKAASEAAVGRKLRGRKPKNPHAARARAAADLEAAKVRAAARPSSTRLAEEITADEQALAEAERTAAGAPLAKIEVNLTDPESRIMKSATGWVQGYNVQVSANAHQVVLAYRATKDHNDLGQLLPMIEATEQEAQTVGIAGPIGLVTADAGYWSEENATAPGPDRLVATQKDWKQRRAARDLGETTGPPPADASPLDQMEHRLRTPEGSAAYATRSHTVEPVFGDVKENRGYRRFMRRGLQAADSEAGLIFAAHNLLKVFHHNPAVVLAR